MQRIVDEEVDHVSRGVKWFLYLCRQVRATRVSVRSVGAFTWLCPLVHRRRAVSRCQRSSSSSDATTWTLCMGLLTTLRARWRA